MKSATALAWQRPYVAQEGAVVLTGLQAIVRIPLLQRRMDQAEGRSVGQFLSGYEGSPLGGLDLELGRNERLLSANDVVFRPGVNEELAATAVMGTQLLTRERGSRHDGVVGYWYGKAPGLDRAADAIRHANHVGTTPLGGVVAFVGDDVSAKSSTLPSRSEPILAALEVPTFVPSDPAEVGEMGLLAVALSRYTGLWTAVKLATSVADGGQVVDLGSPVRRLTTPPYTSSLLPHVPTAQLAAESTRRLERSRVARLAAVQDFVDANPVDRVSNADVPCRLGVAASGETWLALRQALADLGLSDDRLASLGVRLLKIGLAWPLSRATVHAFADGLTEILVFEDKRPFLETQIKEILYGRAGAPVISGKQAPDGTPLVPMSGELDVRTLTRALAQRVQAHGDVDSVVAWVEADTAAGERDRPRLPLLVRTPYFCSGCPHNRSTVVPADSVVGAGMGCHGMIGMFDAARAGDVIGLTQMGGEGAQWIGMEPFTETGHIFQNLGDGTYFHSGQLAVRAAVAAGSHITYKLLYNDAVAMTGGQEATGGRSVPDLVAMLLAEGVSRIIVTTEDMSRYAGVRLAGGTEVWPRERLVEAQEALRNTGGVTVLIHDQECAAEVRRKRKSGQAEQPTSRIFINERICEGCNDCMVKSNCLSLRPVDTLFGTKTEIHQASCNKDDSCVDGECPSFVTVVPGGDTPRAEIEPLPPDAFADPPLTPPDRVLSIRLTGIGGEGVVTAARTIATAATAMGLYVRTADQTGMAQKGGPVVSDLKIGPGHFAAAHASQPGECDVLLGCDLVTSADDQYLRVADRDRTVAVLATGLVPVGTSLQSRTKAPEAGALVARISEACAAVELVDSQIVANTLFGGDQFGNSVIIGAAYQRGVLPVSAAALEDALAAGPSPEPNVQAFRRGRQSVADPDALAAALHHGTASEPLPQDAASLVAYYAADLVRYQSPAYRDTYLEAMAAVRVADDRCGTGGDELTRTAARSLHKLMAYKDEYEVARLAVDPEFRRRVAATFGDRSTYRIMLKPPTLTALGIHRKVRLGEWSRPALRSLYGLRRLRGTRLDPFGRTPVRRLERELRDEFLRVLHDVAEKVTPETYAQAVAIADLPTLVRGYEHVKLDAAAEYRKRLTEALQTFEAPRRWPSTAGGTDS